MMTLLYFLIALILLIAIHEYGHFLVARLCGVKVLRFSLGFGKVIARWQDKKSTEFAISLIPLGGYVKMLDEAEGEVPEAERPFAFNNKSLAARIMIVLAGPLFNFLFAFLCFWLVLVMGIKSLAPMITEIKPGSIAATAGLQAKDEIIGLNGEPIFSWRDFQYGFMSLVGSDETVVLKVKSMETGATKVVDLSLKNWHLNSKKPDLLDSLGIIPFVPTLPPVIGGVQAGSTAETAGLQTGDRIEQLNGQPLSDWLDMVVLVRQNPHKPLKLQLLRRGEQKNVSLIIGSRDNNGVVEGFLGINSLKPDWPQEWLRVQRQNPGPALGTAFQQTVHLTGATFSLIGRFITGRLGWQAISGPVGIAQGAGDSARSGLSYYLAFLGIVSISLGVLNLLPIPMLDGGHLLYYLIEWVRGKPLSEKARIRGMYLGLIFLIMIMVLALSNDVARLLQ